MECVVYFEIWQPKSYCVTNQCDTGGIMVGNELIKVAQRVIISVAITLNFMLDPASFVFDVNYSLASNHKINFINN